MDNGPKNSLEISILCVLDHHRGRENAISRKNLVDKVNSAYPLFPVEERAVRKALKHLVERHGVWIGSWAKGYFVIESTEELERACAYYHGYAMSLLHVEAKLRRVALPVLIGQLWLDIKE